MQEVLPFRRALKAYPDQPQDSCWGDFNDRMYVHVYIYIHVHVYMYMVYVYVCVYVYVYVDVYVDVHGM